MTPTTGHPDEATLVAFLAGRLRGDSQQAVEAHIEHCDACCERLGQLDGNATDTLSGQLRSVDTSPVAVRSEHNSDGTHSESSDLPAELIDHPRYRILEPLGKGGMGVVYKAEHRMMGRTVALKVIDERFINNRQAIERFRNEVQAAGQLNHPNIVRAYDAEQAGNLHFLAMEFVDGISLAELIDRKGPLSADQAGNVVRKVCHGLQHAAKHKMVHRDIKPQNIMVTQDGKVRILDFGLARLARSDQVDFEAQPEAMQRTADALTHVGLVLGTPDYIAPEQARDAHQIDIRADIYSLGCTLYFLLTGRPPFPEGTVMQKMVAHMDQTPEPVQNLQPNVPRATVDVVNRAMQKEPVDRFQSPAEMAAAIESALQLFDDSMSSSPRTDSASDDSRSTDHALGKLAAAAAGDGRAPIRPGAHRSSGSSSRRRDRTSPGRSRKSSAIARALITCIILLAVFSFSRGRWNQPNAEPTAGDSTEDPSPPFEPSSITSGTPSTSRNDSARPGATNLIAIADPNQSVSGSWRREAGQLVVDEAAWARLPLNVDLPAQYDLLIQFTRQTGQHSVGIVFSHGGNRASFEVDAWNSFLGGLQNINGQTLESPSNPTRTNGIQLHNGERCQLLLQVRQNSVRGFMDGQSLFHYVGDGSQLSLLSEWQIPAEATLALIAYESATVFHTVELRAAGDSR